MSKMESTEKLKIYLGDMTYDTVTLSTETFPLNIGFIASYCIKLLYIELYCFILYNTESYCIILHHIA